MDRNPTVTVVRCPAMLWFEREVVGALVSSEDRTVRSSVEAFVDGSLRDMPETLRAGVAGESVLLGAYAAVLRRRGRLDAEAVNRLLDKLEGIPLPLLGQYPRLMRSLVLMAENELTTPKVA
jgi:hypothetical protein